MHRLTLLIGAACLLAMGACDSSEGSDGELARDSCDRECSNLNQGSDCVPAATLTGCKDQCLTVSPTEAQQFADCMDAAFGFECAPKIDCVQNFGVSVDGQNNGSTNNSNNSNNSNNTPSPIETCKTNCDHIATECPETASAVVTADCKAACDAVIPDSVDSFNSCVGANYYSCTSGDLEACYDHLGVTH